MTLASVSGLSKTFFGKDSDYAAIADIDLAIDSGEFVCLLGPSGCGKTTVLNVLSGFVEPTSGTVLFEGKPVVGPARDRAVIFQADNALYDWMTAQENVEFGPRIAGASKTKRDSVAREHLTFVGLGGQGHKYPRELSGGMRQRVQIARVLANNPRMLLMDEPFAALDAQTRRTLQDELRRIWSRHKLGVLFITHDIEEALLLGTRIAVMTAGPGATIKEVIEVPPTLKRSRVDLEFVRMYARIQDLIASETMRSTGPGTPMPDTRVVTESPPLAHPAPAPKPLASGPARPKTVDAAEHKAKETAARAAFQRRQSRERLQGFAIYLSSFALFFTLWHFGTLWFDSVLLPSPLQFMATFFKLLFDGTLIHEAGVSLNRILSGFAIGIAIAIPLGLLMGTSRIIRLILDPYIELLRFIPSIAMITVAVILFGIGESSRVFLIAWVTVFMVTINTAAGVLSIEPNKIRAARAMGANRMQLFWWVTLPATVPFILTGARIAMAGAFTTIVAAEIIGARSGLGQMLWQARLFMLVDNIYVVLVTLSILGLTIDRVFRTATGLLGRKYAPHLS